MQGTSRRVFVFNLDVEAKRKGAILPTLTDLVAIWDKRRRAGKGHVVVGSGDITVALGDVIIDSRTKSAVLLFRHSDKGAAESVYSDIVSNVFRPNAKAATEGGETGAHLFISLAQEKNAPNRYTCILEKVPYLDQNMIRRLLNKIIYDEYKAEPNSFEYENPAGQRTRSGDIRMERCLPKLEFEGRPSANLAKDINDGRLAGITLVKSVTNTQLSGAPFLSKSTSFLKLSIDQGSIPRNAWGSVKKALLAESRNYPTATVSLVPPGSTRTVSIKIDSRTGSPLNDVYIKSHDIIGISPPMRHSSDRVVAQFTNMVNPILLSERSV